MSKIWNSEEYSVADANLRSWATQLGYPRFSAVDYMEELEDALTIDIETNVGIQSAVIPLEYGLIEPYPSPKLPYYKDCWCLKGKNPLGKRAIFFTRKTFNDHPTVIALKNKILAKTNQLRDTHFEELELQLYSKLPITAKAALSDGLLQNVKAKQFEYVYGWFVAHNFSNIPNIEQLSNMVNLGAIPIMQMADGYGHQTGSCIDIDWKNKSFRCFGWSSDD